MRKKGPDELHNNRKSTRKGLTHKCQNCFNLGHNVGTCPNPTHPSSKYFKGTDETLGPEVLSQTTGAPPSSQAQNDSMPPSSTVAPDAIPGDIPSPRRRKQKKSTCGGKVAYVGRRNDDLLGKQFGGSTSGQSTEATISTTKNAKKATVSEVLQNIRNKVRE
ncbi:hypothetical protein BUALT_Bualt06G0072300 [Buddleja alternifolia]|uniref:Uncharacterized protein n=1 Tax=Buddleja alternifolia TaxID=168488 RepID=A0AAV6XHT8_9LAMI|nr:hypothetical protein BUALT_Bualt06G0072300 [Buddleja alternifolia]